MCRQSCGCLLQAAVGVGAGVCPPHHAPQNPSGPHTWHSGALPICTTCSRETQMAMGPAGRLPGADSKRSHGCFFQAAVGLCMAGVVMGMSPPPPTPSQEPRCTPYVVQPGPAGMCHMQRGNTSSGGSYQATLAAADPKCTKGPMDA